MITYTVDEMWAHDPCDDYQYDDLIRLWDGRESLSRLDLTYLTIPPEDIIWACTRDDDDEVTRLFANMVADRVVRDHALHSGVAEVETWARKWLSGGDRSEEAARSAASAGAWATARAAWVAERRHQVEDMRACLFLCGEVE